MTFDDWIKSANMVLGQDLKLDTVSAREGWNAALHEWVSDMVNDALSRAAEAVEGLKHD